MNLPKNWAALRRAGWRSERSGKAGMLQVHHKHGRSDNRLEALEVLTKGEHIDLHRGGLLGPARREWARLIFELGE